jgi:hypothetical protein
MDEGSSSAERVLSAEDGVVVPLILFCGENSQFCYLKKKARNKSHKQHGQGQPLFLTGKISPNREIKN